MTNCTKLFDVMLKQKRKSIYLLFGIQLLAALVIAVFNWFNHNAMQVYFYHLAMTDFLPQWGIFVIALSFLCQLILATIIIFKMQQNCTSQTWRLIPVSDTNFYLVNLLSALISMIYLAVLQLLGLVCIFGLSFMTSSSFHNDFLQEFHQESQIISWNGAAATRLIELIGLVLLLVIVSLLVINLICFCWQIISAAFNGKSNSVILMLLWLLFLSGICRPLLTTLNFLPQALNHPLNFIAGQYLTGVHSTVSFLLLIGILLLAINLYLINKVVEAKANN
ncbi:hypothetical protein [Lactobacillus sp. ESL0703]|uniref:hypothetical protein n=1 Tax=Lactobacillus sp. ESL0703 TaxID=2983218 RepID=UPI0023F9C59A|nr:hypothetical protein [Lactobacillus sp. ESL0703]MDF7668304.1 hypothetical protein [Lactobacillus sp. ESL0703]